ncbi:MAG: hypothetical protein WCG05_03630 [Alphaproteobacteria bacterium]
MRRRFLLSKILFKQDAVSLVRPWLFLSVISAFFILFLYPSLGNAMIGPQSNPFAASGPQGSGGPQDFSNPFVAPGPQGGGGGPQDPSNPFAGPSPQQGVQDQALPPPPQGNVDFNIDYVVVKKHRIPTQEIFANEICIFIAALARREDLGKVPPHSIKNLKLFLTHIYRSTNNSALQNRIKDAIKFIAKSEKKKFDIETVIIDKKHYPTVEFLADQLCILISVLARQNELDQVNQKALTRTMFYLTNLLPITQKDLLKKRIMAVQNYIGAELSKNGIQTDSSGKVIDPMANPMGSSGVLPLISPFPIRGAGAPPKADEQKRLARLAGLVSHNLMDPSKLSPADQASIGQIMGSGSPLTGGFNPFPSAGSGGGPQGPGAPPPPEELQNFGPPPPTQGSNNSNNSPSQGNSANFGPPPSSQNFSEPTPGYGPAGQSLTSQMPMDYGVPPPPSGGAR